VDSGDDSDIEDHGIEHHFRTCENDDNPDVDDDCNDDNGDDVHQALEYVERFRNHPQRLHRMRINRKEDAAIFAANREYLPARYHRSIRAQFHRVAELPPAP
jgi:hypothetical protein